MGDQPFVDWLAAKTWAQGVRYSKAVALLLPLAALAVDAPYFAFDASAWPPHVGWLLAWQLAAELFFLTVIAVDRWLPQCRGHQWAVNMAVVAAMVFATWIGVVDAWRIGDISIFAAGSTFVATVMCTTRPVRRPMYALGLAALAWPAWEQAATMAGFVAAMVNPFCVAVLCIELDRFAFSRNRELYAETQRAKAEHLRADKVLYNVLPASIADELKRNDKVSAVKFENLGVLFADIVGFTGFSRSLPPDALVLMLNAIFSSFDELVDKYGLEKIKTIGDAYMATSNHRIDDLCNLALDMREGIDRYNRSNGTVLSMRIGLHAGPAVAGVLGVKRFLYDVWGDTVNVASRMEGSGEPGRIQVTEAVYLQARDHFTFEAREPIEIKGRGLMATYWLTGRRES